EDEAARFWRAELEELSAFLALPDGRGAAEAVELRAALSEPATAALGELARAAHTTLNTVVQGAWALLLARRLGSDDVVFGATVAGRPPTLRGVETMIGLFI